MNMPAKGNFGEYYLGLDIGTDSVGWAVTDKNYEILRFKGKAMWGVHLFDGGKTAEDRRMHRAARRRLERRKWRLNLLRGLFEEEIAKTDPLFFERLDESNFVSEDREHKQHNSLFNDPSFNDKSLFEKYPTIYHLREDMMKTSEKPDIRLVYLACHHIVKYRGHFLYENISDGEIPEFGSLFRSVIDELNEVCGTEISTDNVSGEIEMILLNGSLGVREKANELGRLITSVDASKGVSEFVNLISGGTCKLREIFDPEGDDDDLKDEKLKFSDTDWEARRPELEGKIPDGIYLLDLAKQVYDWATLKRLLGKHKYVSSAKIDEFEQHREDLRLLKKVVKEHLGKGGYADVFKDRSSENNYAAYSKMGTDKKACTQEDFCKFLKKKLEKEFLDPAFESGEYRIMKERVLDGTFVPKQTSKENVLLPNILHLKELTDILANCSKWYPFLETKDDSGHTVSSKIEQLCKFRIPYYIGPLSPNAKNGWMVRKGEGRILPWNFDDLVDKDKSSEGFMNNLIGPCTYLPGEKVLPRNSLLYSRFTLYNELNTLSINGKRIDVGLKKEIVKDIFEKLDGPKKITKRTFESYFRKKGLFHNEDKIEGIDDNFRSDLKSEYQIKAILKEKYKTPLAEEIIRSIVVFGDDRKRLKGKLYSDYSEILTKEEIDGLSVLQFKEWGRLSEKFLTGIRAPVDGREMNILTAMEQTDLNLNEILFKYDFKKQIDAIRDKTLGITSGKITYDLVEDLQISPSVRRGAWRALRIVDDILNAAGRPPAKIFIETTREKRESKRTVSRKEDLIRLYKACKEEEWIKKIEGEDEGRLRSKKLYSYYCQHGQCMYCGVKIDPNDLGDTNKCDMDHIIPRSLKTDDSIHNNMALVCKTCNTNKSAVYPVSPEIQNKMGSMWKSLLACKFITEEKYKRLTEVRPLTEEELSGFIGRQLVETGWSVKAVADTFRRLFEDKSEVVYVKGGNVSEFRNNKGFVKCRSVNDYHHAKDAYLNIVVGNVYHTKFTSDPLKFMRTGEKYTLNIEKIFDGDVKRSGESAWTKGEAGSIAIVKKHMNQNNILFTRFAHKAGGQLYNLNPLKRGKGQHPLKTSGKERDIDKYGGYDKVAGSYFTVVEHKAGKKVARTIQPVPVMLNNDGISEKELLEYYSREGLDEPKIVFNTIRTNAMIEIDGFKLHISGRTASRILYKCGEQLTLPNETYNYCKKLYNHNERSKEAKRLLSAEDYELTAEENLKTYDIFIEKFNGKYKMIPDGLGEKLSDKRELFKSLGIEKQAEILNEVLHGFQCNSTAVNLKRIEEFGGSSAAGVIDLMNDLTKFESVKLISQSPSGLFENEIDLKTI
jgi:CRISPR-associated endonuclease Csn1